MGGPGSRGTHLSDVFVAFLDVLGCPDNELVDAVNVGFLWEKGGQ